MRARFKSRNAILAGAVAAALLAAGQVGAVALSPRGVGQVLIYPYYTVNGGNQTLLTVVNTGDRVKAVKVRIREARNGREVLDFNLYLGAFDVWTGAVLSQTAQGPAALLTEDTSCTVPQVRSNRAVPLRNYLYSGANADTVASQAEFGSLDRTREGYIEVIDMGSLQNGPGPLQLADEATHGIDGLPINCEALTRAWLASGQVGSFAGSWATDPAQNIDLPSGGLYGTGAIINVGIGSMVAYQATALSEFYTNAAAPSGLNRGPASGKPDLADANNGSGVAIARVFTDNGAIVDERYGAGSAQSVDAVSLVLMQTTIFNDYSVDPNLGAATEWVLTFPTKRHYVDLPLLTDFARPPFSNAFRDDGHAGDQFGVDVFSREQLVVEVPTDPCGTICGVPPPSPPPPATDSAANVLVMSSAIRSGSSDIFGARIGGVGTNVVINPPFGANFDNGWAALTFEQPLAHLLPNFMVGPTTHQTYRGLPVIGFSAFRYINADAQPGRLANYAGAIGHHGTLKVDAP